MGAAFWGAATFWLCAHTQRADVVQHAELCARASTLHCLPGCLQIFTLNSYSLQAVFYFVWGLSVTSWTFYFSSLWKEARPAVLLSVIWIIISGCETIDKCCCFVARAAVLLRVGCLPWERGCKPCRAELHGGLNSDPALPAASWPTWCWCSTSNKARAGSPPRCRQAEWEC